MPGVPRVSSAYERELKSLLEARGFYVVRAAGSHGLDLVATRPSRARGPETYIVEEKSTRKSAFYVGGAEAKAQWAQASSLATAGHEVLYAIRFKGGSRRDRWQLFPVDGPCPKPMRRGEGLLLDDVFGPVLKFPRERVPAR